MSKNKNLELRIKQYATIDSCVHLEMSSMEINDLIEQAYGTETMTQSKVCKWCEEFRDAKNNDWTCRRFWSSTNSQNWNNGEHVKLRIHYIVFENPFANTMFV